MNPEDKVMGYIAIGLLPGYFYLWYMLFDLLGYFGG